MKRKSKRRRSERDTRIHRRTEPGAPPGVVVPEPGQPKPVIQTIAYGNGGVVERQAASPDEAFAFVGRHPMVWINVEGLGDAATIERFGELFGLHRLALEDTVNLHQRAKLDDYGEVLFLVLRMIYCGDLTNRRCATEQLSLFLGPNWLISFQEGQPGDSFDRVRARIREGSGKVRQLEGDYLAYALIDATIDNYYPVLEVYAERLDHLEDRVLERSDRTALDSLHEVKSDLLILRRAIWPLRDAIAQLVRDDHPRIQDHTRLYLRDCYDHVIQVVDLLETYRELTADLRDLFMSTTSNRINETMRVLTIISTIFMPLTFIAGIYGMNFEFMPELHWRYGYLFAWGIMIGTAGALFYFFRLKKWL